MKEMFKCWRLLAIGRDWRLRMPACMQNARRLAILEERDRIGMDLHDGIIQSIYGVGFSLESALHSINEDPNDARAKVQHSIEWIKPDHPRPSFLYFGL